jgi:Flp pilus assembly protein TadG
MVIRQKPRLWKKAESEKGQSLVEFALVMIFIIIPITFCLIETSILLYKYVAVTNAAREGARTGSIYLHVGDPGGSFTGPDTGRSAAVATTVGQSLGPLIVRSPDCAGTVADTICRISYDPATDPTLDPLRSSDVMTVTITHTHSYLFGALGSEIDLRAQASMRIEPSVIISGTTP